jgi:NAD(P)-dependent dehydrogenase (short-subunit alcohol dehydrogenase family)
MEIAGKVAVVTGGGNGIGRALCRRFAAEGARGVVVADLDADGAVALANDVGGLAVATDVSVEADVQRLVEAAIDAYGAVDLLCSNAGILTEGSGVEANDEDWDRIWRVNVLAHVYAARAVVPHMLERGEGYLLNTASAAGLLTLIGHAPYAVTKHAAVALAEWLAITYGERGLRVSCLCPMFVNTALLREAEANENGPVISRLGPTIEPEVVAEAVVAGIEAERFLILPHPEVAGFFARKAADHDRWLAGMRRLQADVASEVGKP